MGVAVFPYLNCSLSGNIDLLRRPVKTKIKTSGLFLIAGRAGRLKKQNKRSSGV